MSSGGRGSFTLTMWVKTLPNTYTDQQGLIRPVIQFFSSLSPPQPLMTIHFQGDILYVVFALHCGDFVENVGVSAGGTFSVQDWECVSVVYDSTAGSEVHISIMHNSRVFHEVHHPKWCPSSSGRFLEGVSFSHEFLVTPILFRPGNNSISWCQAQKRGREFDVRGRFSFWPERKDMAGKHSEALGYG
eukprot:2512812-Rhodomonas_salina.4